MSNNPVQIILNHEDFLRAPEPGQAGPGKDFFAGADTLFARHKQTLLTSLDRISKTIKESSFGPAAYIKVQMRSQALAKSYRPNRWLFTDEQFPCVGADGIGTIYFRAPLIYLQAIRLRMEQAELTVEIRVSKKTGEQYSNPSRARSEVGAIETVSIAPAADKRTFSTSAGIQMMKDPRTASGYRVELFETPTDNVIADDPLGQRALLKSLEKNLLELGPGTRTILATKIGRTPVLEIQLTKSKKPAVVDNRLGLATRDISPLALSGPPDFNQKRHKTALIKLAQHPLVRKILPPIQLQLSESQKPPGNQDDTSMASKKVTIPEPAAGATYPIVGVIDTGVASILDPWVVERFDYLSKEEHDTVHGTYVAGLISLGQSANSPAVTPERNGCLIYDAPLYPIQPFLSKYPGGFEDFLEEVEQVVAEANRNYGVKIFNISINATSEVEPYRYSDYAARLDSISATYGVIFVNSAGNLKRGEARAPWQKRPIDVVRYFASRTQSDTILCPAESVRSISVGALNPPNTDEIEGAPTVYTRRGPGLQVGVKPDVATYGGTGIINPSQTSGLTSIDVNGLKTDVVGTSFAAPLIARTLAGLDISTQGGLDSEALRAMLLHHTYTPEPLTKRGLKDLARQFAGFGRPPSVADMLETDDHQITLVFQSRLTVGERRPAILRFPFEWPQSLATQNGACSGRAKITLVYSPPLDPAFGAEFARVNLEANLLQRQPKIKKDGTPSYTSQITPRYLRKTTGLAVPEKALIDHGLKWWPSKQYESNLKNRGQYSSWRLEVTSLVRAEAQFPPEGIPFALLLTIEDPEGIKPIFQEMRQALQVSQANAHDIRTATRLRTR
jgi:Subtilase family